MIKCVFVNNTISQLKPFSITYNFWDVTNKLNNGKEAEFWVEKDSLGFFVEAKNLNSNGLHEIIYSRKYNSNRAMGTFTLNEKQQTLIRERFKSQYNKAKGKFKNTTDNHSIFINLNFPLGTLGQKLQTYVNKLLNGEHHKNLIYIGIFASGKIYLYDAEEREIETINYP